MSLVGGIARGAAAVVRSGKFGRSYPRGSLARHRGNKDYYKGRGGLKPGVHTRKGGYRLRDEKQIDLRAPDLSGFKLKPYVAMDTARQPRQAQTSRE